MGVYDRAIIEYIKILFGRLDFVCSHIVNDVYCIVGGAHTLSYIAWI